MVSASQARCATNDELNQAADKAKEAAASVGSMAGHAACAVGAMASHAADDLAVSAGIEIQGLGDRLSQNTPHAGVLGNASQAVARAVKDSGEYIESAKLSGITEDIAQVIRRNPISAVLIAIGLGWYVGRKVKG